MNLLTEGEWLRIYEAQYKTGLTKFIFSPIKLHSVYPANWWESIRYYAITAISEKLDRKLMMSS